MNKMEFLENLKNVENLPTLPAVVRQLQTLMTSPHSSMAQIAAVITRDQAIAARVVRLINSAFYGMGGKVTSIQHAIVLLGLHTIRNLVTGVSVVKMFECQQNAPLFDREKFWLHTFACALGARTIGRELKVPEPEDFFLAGLLHDIGILILDQVFHDEFNEILMTAVNERIEYIDAERKVICISHQEIGGFIARKWKIPEILINAIHFHHDPAFTEGKSTEAALIISAVHITDMMASNMGVDIVHPVGKATFDAAAMRTVGLTECRIEELYKSVMNEVKAVAAEWGV